MGLVKLCGTNAGPLANELGELAKQESSKGLIKAIAKLARV